MGKIFVELAVLLIWQCLLLSGQDLAVRLTSYRAPPSPPQASQCTELDVLVPLRYRASKLILVGDPLQLPATIYSRQAERQGYGQSLFERLYRHFISQTNEAGIVHCIAALSCLSIGS